jgi:hypothetical protein
MKAGRGKEVKIQRKSERKRKSRKAKERYKERSRNMSINIEKDKYNGTVVNSGFCTLDLHFVA